MPPSLRSRLRLAVAALAACLALAGSGTLWATHWAMEEVRRSEASFARLERASAVERAFNRYLLTEVARRLDPTATPEALRRESADAAALRGALLAYRRESAAQDDGADRAGRVRAVALAALFDRIETEAMIDRATRPTGADSARAFLATIGAERDKSFRSLVAEALAQARAEAEAAFARLETFRSRAGGAVWALALGLTAAAALFARGVHRALLGPIRAMAAAAEALGRGALDARAPAGLPGEFAPLAARFDAMAARIGGERARLEAEVAARTAELAEANAALREVDARRRRFLAAVSHELRTPMTVLLAEAQVALRAGAAEAGRAALGRIAASGGFLRRRIDDLMALARSEDGALQLSPAPCDLAAEIGAAVEAAQAYAAASEVALAFEAPDEAAATADAGALRQAALALIDNAVKMSPPGGRVAARLARAGGCWRLTVEDDGPGFAAGAAEALFEPYAQGPEGRRAGGAGLGLAIVRWIAAEHGGAAGAETRPEGGARVWLEVPA
jgi:signal transduction histidine kinase